MNVKELPVRDLLLARCATWDAYENLWYNGRENLDLLRAFQAVADELDNRLKLIINNIAYNNTSEKIICKIVEEGVEISYNITVNRELYDFYIRHLETSGLQGEVIL